MGAGEDEDKQEVSQSHVTAMDTSARSKVDLVRMVLCISVDTLTYRVGHKDLPYFEEI